MTEPPREEPLWAPSLAPLDTPGGMAPALGTPGAAPRRQWWRNLRGPIAVLLGDLESPQPLVRRRAATALVRLGDRRAAPALAAAARDTVWEVRLACIEALGALGGDGVVAALCRACRDGHPKVRLAAAEGLVRHGELGAVAALEALLAHVSAYGTAGERERIGDALARLKARLGA